MTLADLLRGPTVPTRRAKVQAFVGVVFMFPEIVSATVKFADSMIRTLYGIHLNASPIRATAPSTRPSGPPPAASASSAPTTAAQGDASTPVRAVSEIPTPPLGGFTEVRIPSPVEDLADGYPSAINLVRTGPILEN